MNRAQQQKEALDKIRELLKSIKYEKIFTFEYNFDCPLLDYPKNRLFIEWYE